MKKKFLFAVAIFFLAVAFYSPREASAVPAFARQTGMACNTCHFQHFPVLNSFGRAFKAGGYTMVGGQSMVEGDFLSLPATLNASLVSKVRYQKRNGDDDAQATNKGELQFPDEAALLIGGRAGEHVGFLIEASLKDGDSRFTSYKMPVVFDVQNTKLNVIPFSTDAAGTSYGLELLNTGAMKIQRPIEHGPEISAQQYIGTNTAATGFAFGAVRGIGFVNYTLWYKSHGDAAAGPFLNYIRAAVTPNYMGWDLALGAQYWGGTSKEGGGAGATTTHAEAWAIDAQAQGMVADFPVGVYLSYANAKKSDSAAAADLNIFNNSTNKDKSAFAIMAEVGVIPSKLTVSAGYRAGKDGDANGDGKDSDNATTLAAVYTPIQNLNLQLNYTWYSGEGQLAPTAATGDQKATLMVFAAF
ncbi:MAG: hypothetical protein ACE5GY_02090 [Thermodesulfobacteriota bacterium]